jgi:hypothetical protein
MDEFSLPARRRDGPFRDRIPEVLLVRFSAGLGGLSRPFFGKFSSSCRRTQGYLEKALSLRAFLVG